jgi:hypothetical protein
MSDSILKDNVYTLRKKKWALTEIYEILENFNADNDNITDKIVDPLG